MSHDNVIPFRKRRPSDIDVETYERMTRDWQPELKELMFPEHFRRQRDGVAPPTAVAKIFSFRAEALS